MYYALIFENLRGMLMAGQNNLLRCFVRIEYAARVLKGFETVEIYRRDEPTVYTNFV